MKIPPPFMLLTLLFISPTDAAQQVAISEFATEGLSDWSTKAFSGTTQYKLITEDKMVTLKAQSYASASAIAKEQRIDLKQTPYINWSWRIDNRLSGLAETSKGGDDYSARLYIIKDGGWRLWRTLALNYVWSSNQKIGQTWDNAFAPDNAKMIAVRGKQSETGLWQTEKRNVYTDLISEFGDKGSAVKNEKAYRYIDAVALMTDTDNSKLDATGYYRNIYFSAD